MKYLLIQQLASYCSFMCKELNQQVEVAEVNIKQL